MNVRMPWTHRRSAIAGAAVLAGVVVLALLLPALLRDRSPAPVSNAGAGTDYGPAPDYTLTDQHGRTVNSSSFAGKVQVVSYLFPYCTTYCPVIARNLVTLRKDLVDAGLGDRVALVAFNVDPAGAGPAQMRAFWSEFGGDPSDPGFEFLTGTPEQVHSVVADGFHVYYQKVNGAEGSSSPEPGDPSPAPTVPNKLAERAHVDYDIQHNDFIEIVDGQGRIRQIFNTGSQVAPDALMTAVRAALG